MRKVIILIISIYFLFITICLIALGSHYVSVGECAAITYYYPLTWWDRAGIILFGIIATIISLRLISKDMKNRKIKLTIISLIYMLSVGLYVIFGNEILGTREIDWPHNYKVSPIPNSSKRHIKIQYILPIMIGNFHEQQI